MYKEKKVEKLFYSISEVSEMFGVKPSLLRYWEEEFDTLRPRKNSRGVRMYTDKDIETLHLIYHYAKERGMKLSGVKAKLKENRVNADNDVEVVSRLQNIRSMLKEILDNLKTE